MNGEIIKVHALKQSGRFPFQRIEFKLDDGSWAKCDLCPAFRNYARWKPFLSVGAFVGGLRMRDSQTVDGDSFPVEWNPAFAGGAA